MKRYVLMLENDSDDRYFTESTMDELGLDIAMRYDVYSPALLKTIAEKPSLVLLAYNTFPENGLEILRAFKSDPQWSYIPVVVLTEQMPPDHVRAYYEAGASSVIKKPSTIEATTAKINTFFKYWMGVVELQ